MSKEEVTPTPKSKLTPSKSKSLDEILEAVINGNGPRPRFDPQMTIAEAKTAILSLFRELVPESKDTTAEQYVEAIYRVPPKDGETVTITHVNYDERHGWNACRNEILKRLEGL